MSEEIQRLLLRQQRSRDPSENLGCIVRCKTPSTWSVSARTSVDEVTLDNNVMSVGSLFGCLAITPFTNLVFDAGSISMSPEVNVRRGMSYKRHQLSIEQIDPGEMERTVLENGSIEILGNIRLNYQDDQGRRQNPFPNQIDVQNRAASVVGREKNAEIDWLFTQDYHYRATYTFNEESGPYTYDDQLSSHCRPLHNLRANGTTRARRQSNASGHRRTLHETARVGQILSCILGHEHYRAMEPTYNIKHQVRPDYMWFKGIARSVTIEIAITPTYLHEEHPQDGLDFLQMNRLANFPKKSSDKTNWITEEDSLEGINLMSWKADLEAESDGLLKSQLTASIHLEPQDTKNIEMESVDITHASLVSFAKVTSQGHIYLLVPFDLEFDRENKMIVLPKGGYRVRIHGYYPWNLRLVHLVITGLLRDISFTAVSDRVQSLGELTQATLERQEDPTTIKQEDVENRLTTIEQSLSDSTVTEKRYID